MGMWVVVCVLGLASDGPVIASVGAYTVAVTADPEVCQDVVRAIANDVAPNWQANPFSHWHWLLEEAADGEIELDTWPWVGSWYSEKEQARARAWVVGLVLARDKMPGRIKYKKKPRW